MPCYCTNCCSTSNVTKHPPTCSTTSFSYLVSTISTYDSSNNILYELPVRVSIDKGVIEGIGIPVKPISLVTFQFL